MTGTMTFQGTTGTDTFNGGAEDDLFEFTTDTLQPADTVRGGGGTNAVALINEDGDPASYTSADFARWSNIQDLALGTAGGGGFELTLGDSFYTTNKESSFIIDGSYLTGVTGFLDVDASAVTKFALTIAGSVDGEDHLTGGSGNDTFIYGGTSLDVEDHIHGGGGNDTIVLVGTGVAPPVKEGVGTGATTSASAPASASTYLGDVTSVESIVVTGLAAGQTRLIGFGNGIGSVLYGGTGVTTISTNANYGGTGAATPVAGSLQVNGTSLTASQAIHATGGNGSNAMQGGAGSDWLTGGNSADQLYGGAGNDAIVGGGGNDIIYGGPGADAMNGGAGNDTFIIADNNMTSTGELYHDSIDGGADTDVLKFQGQGDYTITAAELDAETIKNIEQINFSAVNSNVRIAFSNSFVENNHDTKGYLQIVLPQATNANSVFNVDASAVTDAKVGIAVLIPASSANTITGGAGSDAVVYQTGGVGAGDILHGNGGIDTIDVLVGSSSVIEANVTGFEKLTFLAASSGNQTSSAEIVTATAMTIDLRAEQASDLAYFFGFNVNSNNTIGTESTGALTVYGGIGNDHLYGGNGNDLISSGGGTDYMDGQGGTNTVSYFDETAGVTVDLSNTGAQTISGSTQNLLLNFQNITGSAFADTLTGTSGANVIDGGAGADTMIGGGGNDTYYVDNAGDKIVEAVNGGTDLVYSTVSYTLGDNVEKLILNGTGNINGTGNALGNAILGNAGNNVLNGGAGADSMAGGLGNDTYFVDNGGDAVTEATNGGTDLVHTTINYALTANVENLVLDGTGNINGTGNALNNAIVGNNGNNVLNGAAGADTMKGGLGNDTYYVDNAGDTVIEAANAGSDTVHATINYTLADNVENLVLDGSTGLKGTGNALSNAIVGSGGGDTISGMGGNDIIEGLAGADLLTGGAGSDTFVYKAASDSGTSAPDLITDFTTGSDKIDLSALHLASTGEIRISTSGSYTFVTVDTDNNGTADMLIKLAGANAVKISDIITGISHAASHSVPSETTPDHHDLEAALHAAAAEHGLYG